MREIELPSFYKSNPPQKLSVPEAEAWYRDYQRLGGKGTETDFINEMETYMYWIGERKRGKVPSWVSYRFNPVVNVPERPEEDIFDVLGDLHESINQKHIFGKLPGLI
jgi:hypothetical protein